MLGDQIFFIDAIWIVKNYIFQDRKSSKRCCLASGYPAHIHTCTPNVYVSLRLRMQNAVPAQPCVGKY